MNAVDQVKSALAELIHTVVPLERRRATSLLVENQLAYFERCAQEMDLGGGILDSSWGHNGAKTWQDTFTTFGQDWIPRFLGAITQQMSKTLLFDLLRFEIASNPVEKITFAHIHRGTGEEDSPRFALRFQDVERKMQPRRGPRIDWGEDMLCDWDGSRRRFIEEELWGVWASEVFKELERDMLRDMAECARGHGYALTSPEEFLKTVERESEGLHTDSQTGPANKLLVNSKMAVDLPITDKTHDPHNYGLQRIGLLDGRWDVYADPFFQEHEAMLWRYTPETGHSGMLSFLHYFALPGHLTSTRIRYTKLITNDKFFRLLRIQ